MIGPLPPKHVCKKGTKVDASVRTIKLPEQVFELLKAHRNGSGNSVLRWEIAKDGALPSATCTDIDHREYLSRAIRTADDQAAKVLEEML